ncbi:hypothetical protein BKA70DRAFT_1250954 [Coprinopsis sp. MPI-PUGE-AT-0042]|nr:hypothetical protein BKA70DRAFT_1250954 [Coprinopsis sp. MPI-PUGE-AT-0042]
MSITVTVPEGFQYVGAALTSTLYVLFLQYRLVNKTRAKAGIEYPQMYADRQQQAESKDAVIFNCAQRAHGNTTENLPLVYISTVLTGLFYPKVAAINCALWSLGRIAYTYGYVTGDPKKRINPLHAFGSMALLGNFAFATFQSGYWIYKGLTA